jgi:tRNA (cmo5U34)-methyltransferase
MSHSTATYRWNTSDAAAAYDAAAPVIHPYYQIVQNHIVGSLPFARDDKFLLVDLGGGSGRLVERLLDHFEQASAILIDQSAAFLALAERRLLRFGRRITLVERQLQGDWPRSLPAAPQAIVSTSAIHHLDPVEKIELYSRINKALTAGGVFINGDEYRPESDADYRDCLERWSKHMRAALAGGRIPSSFQQTLDDWHDRNIRNFGAPKHSGDDCVETLAAQRDNLDSAGFQSTDTIWNEQLWGVLRAPKAGGTS